MTLSIPANRQLRGVPVARTIETELAAKVQQFPTIPKLVILLVGDNSASMTYVQKKKEAALRVGIQTDIRTFATSVTTEKLLEEIQDLNQDPEVTGYIVQLPLPDHIALPKLVAEMAPLKDVDGFTTQNAGALFLGNSTDYLPPATSRGVLELLLAYGIALEGQHVVMVGRSNLVGKPLALELLGQNATVTLCHSKTKHLAEFTRQADILVSAVGKMHLITAEMVRDGAVMIDVGFHKTPEGLFGDIHPRALEKASAYAPVPGGVGAVTVASLLQNVVSAYTLAHLSL